MYLEESIEKINDRLISLKGKKNIVIWGAAEKTVRLFQYTDIIKYNVTTIVDNGKSRQTFFGRIIMTANEVDWNVVDAVVISSFFKENEIFLELTEKYNFTGTIIRLRHEKQERPFYQHLFRSELQVPLEYRKILQMNEEFHNIHHGEKIFIIGNGPSIKDTDLTKIRNAKKMVVSNFYLHKDYNVIKPDYYCFPQFTYTNSLNENFYHEWLCEIGEKSGKPQFFFNISEKGLIDQCRYFDNKKVNYMFLENLNADYYDEIDITGKMMGGQSASINCIQLAIYMGFKEIYLVGIEHSEIITRQYNYFYERQQSIMGNKDSGILNNGEVKSGFRVILKVDDRLWKQYESLKMISEVRDVKIYNATKGGILDVFDRTDYDLLF